MNPGGRAPKRVASPAHITATPLSILDGASYPGTVCPKVSMGCFIPEPCVQLLHILSEENLSLNRSTLTPSSLIETIYL